MSRPTQTARPALGRGLAAAIAISLGLGGACTTARNALGTTAGPCFRDQAVATTAVHHRGRLVGVRRITAPHLASRLPAAASLPPREVCVFAFKGAWQAKDVDRPRGLPAGRYALVVVGARHGNLEATFLDDKLPTRFRHL